MKKFLSVLLAVMMVLSTVSFAAPTAIGTYEGTGADYAEPVLVPDEAELASEYGTLLFDIDFESEKFASGELGASSAVANYSSKEQPTLPEQFTGYYALVGNTFEPATEDRDNFTINDTTVLKNYNSASTVTYPFVAIRALTDSSWSDNAGWPDGTYTVVADAAYDYNNSTGAIVVARMADTGENAGGKSVGASQTMRNGDVIGEFPFTDTFVVTWDVINNEDGTTTVTAENGATLDFATITSMGLYFGQMGNNPDFIYVDNYQMYWKPNTVSVTINNNGEEVATVAMSTKGVLVSDIVKAAGIGAEYSVTEVLVNGEKVLLADTVTFGADSVVDITSEMLDLSAYQDDTKGKLLFNITFEDYEIGDAPLENWASSGNLLLTEGYKTPYADAIMSHDLTNWALMYNNSGAFTVMADPDDENNKVFGTENVTSTGYPGFRINTGVDNTAAMYGFVEEDDGVFTLEYDVKDVNGNLQTTDRFGGRSSVAANFTNSSGVAYDQWTELEDTPKENHATAVAGEYVTHSATYSSAQLTKLGSTAEVSFIKIHAKTPTNNTYYFDNIRVWYKPGKADLTVKHIGVDLPETVIEDVSTSGVSTDTLLESIDTSSIDTFTYRVTGFTFNEDGSDVIEGTTVTISEDSTIYLVWEEVDMSEWQDENGTILFDIDFDELTDGTQLADGTLVSTFGRVNPYISGSDTWRLVLSGFATGEVEDGVLKIVKSAAGKYPQVHISALDGDVLVSDGTIYKKADMKFENTSGIRVQLGLTGYARKYNSDTSKWEGTTNDQNAVQSVAFANTVAGQWYTLSGTAVLEGAEYNSEYCTIYITTYETTGGAGDAFYLDNLRLYWKPASVNVKVSHSGVDLASTTLTGVSTAGITADELLALVDTSSVSAVTYTVKGVSFTADGAEIYSGSDVITLAADTELYIIWEEVDMSEYMDENGILLFELNFDDLEVGTTIKDQTKLTTFAKVNPNFAKYDEWAIQISTFTSPATVTDFDDDGNNELSFSYSATGKYPQILVGHPTNNAANALTGGGTYYASSNIYVPSSATDLYQVSITNNGIVDGVHMNSSGLMPYGSLYAGKTLIYDTWFTIASAKNTEDAGIDDITKITHLFTMSNGGKGPYTFYLDSIKLYWKPTTVKATIDMGENTEAEDVTFDLKTSGVTVEDAMANVLDWGSKKLVGLSLTEGGEAIAAGTVLSPCNDVTYYAVWGDYDYAVLDGYGAEFNGSTVYNEIRWSGYGNGGDNVAMHNYSYAPYTEDATSYGSFKSITKNESTGAVDAQFLIENPLPAGALKGIAVRMRVDGFPTEETTVVGITDDGTEYTKTWDPASSEILKMYLNLGSLGLAEGRTLKLAKNFETTDFNGKWLTVYFDLTTETWATLMAENSFNAVRVDFADGFMTDAVVDIDYIRFYGDDSALYVQPDSQNDDVSMRANAGNEDGYNGIRFKAEITGEVEEATTDYGWVAAATEKVGTYAITLGATNTVTFYGREAGVDKVKFFEETDTLKTFTAVVYNIKAEYAKKQFVVRPFVKAGDNVYYGEPMVKSVYAVACEIRDNGYGDADKDYIDSVIAAADALEA